MFVQTQNTPNPNSLKFLPSKEVSNDDPFEITDKNKSDNELVKNILSINGVTGIFLAEDFLSVNKKENTNWEDVKHIVISLINEFYSKLKISVEEEHDSKMILKGIIFTGLGEGAYYMSLEGYKKQFKKHLNFIPYPGTLNLRMANNKNKILYIRSALLPLPNKYFQD